MTPNNPNKPSPRRKATRAQGPASEPGGVAAGESAGGAESVGGAESSGDAAPVAASEPVSIRKSPVSESAQTQPATESAGSGATVFGDDSTVFGNEPAAGDMDEAAQLTRKHGNLVRWGGAAAAVVLVVALVAAVILLALVKNDGVNAKSEAYIQTARQGVLNLTTIHYATAPEDVQHLLDGASGEFAKDFGGRKDSYIQVVQKAQVNSDGKINTAGLEKLEENTGVVLVAATAKVSNSAAPGGEERSYRLRVEVTDNDGRMTVSNVQFVP